MLSFDSFLQKLANTKELHHEFKLVQPDTFAKMEKFVLNQLDKYLNNLNMNHDYNVKSKLLRENLSKKI